jgi:hypothetical protein
VSVYNQKKQSIMNIGTDEYLTTDKPEILRHEQYRSDEICCPKFDPAPWDDKRVEWKDKLFIKDHVFTLFFVPINFAKVIARMNTLVEGAGANIPDMLCLSDHTSRWNMDLYLAVNKTIPGAQNMTLSGTFYSRVYEGSYQDTGKWCKDYESKAKAKGHRIKKWYMWYTTCPKCAKKYGKNYVVILSQVE